MVDRRVDRRVDRSGAVRLASGALPEAQGIVFVEAHDSVHGWSPSRLRVDLAAARNGRVRVTGEE